MISPASHDGAPRGRAYLGTHLRTDKPWIFASHNFVANHFHAAATNGGGGPSGPSSPPSGPSWWRDFEREFGRYVASRAARRRSSDLVTAAPRERALAPPER